MTDLVLLGALLRGPAYGYALKSTAGLIFGRGSLHSNIVYPALKRFGQNGWVTQRATPGRRGQTRKQYRITAAGKRHLLERLQAFGEDDAADESAFLLRVALFDLLPHSARTAIIAARASFLRARSDQLSQLAEKTQPRSFSAVALARVREQVDDEQQWIRGLAQQRVPGK
jgi:DNA-binding PadR family transcriptional regulator